MKIQLSMQNGITAHALARMCRGVLQNEENSKFNIYSICTDSREVDENTAFFALVGERVNGHNFIPAAKSPLEKNFILIADVIIRGILEIIYMA